MRHGHNLMRDGERFPEDQAEVVLSTEAVEWIAEHVEESRWDEVLDDILALFTQPAGKHPLSNRGGTDRLAGLNTTATLGADCRIVFRSSVSSEGTGLIEIIALGKRSDNRIYDAVNALITSGKLTEDEAQSVWEMLALYETTAEKHGLELWDYRPEPAPPGLIRSAVASGALPLEIAEQLTKDEINEALTHAWDPERGEPDPARALAAALGRVATSSTPERIMAQRSKPRCGAHMPIADQPCIRVRGHAGAHRAVA